MLHDGPEWSYLRQGLLRAVYVAVVKGHTLWHMYTGNKVKTAIQLQATIVKWYCLHVVNVWALKREFRFDFTCFWAQES